MSPPRIPELDHKERSGTSKDTGNIQKGGSREYERLSDLNSGPIRRAWQMHQPQRIKCVDGHFSRFVPCVSPVWSASTCYCPLMPWQMTGPYSVLQRTMTHACTYGHTVTDTTASRTLTYQKEKGVRGGASSKRRERREEPSLPRTGVASLLDSALDLDLNGALSKDLQHVFLSTGVCVDEGQV